MFSQEQILRIISNVLKKWHFLLIAALIGAAVGYIRIRSKLPVYTSNISFVLSTDPRPNSGLYNLATQLGFDAISSNPDNIFSGDNIIELFKSRKLIGAALLSEIDTKPRQTLINLIARKQFKDQYNSVGPFGNDLDKFSPAQKMLYQQIISFVEKSFIVFKKDKKLIIYIISVTSTNSDITYYTAKVLLDETSRYFIETKTKVFASGVKLLQHEADSLANVLSGIFSSTASMNDRTYDLNPAITVQRSGSMFNQAKAAAYDAAYIEVMRNLEIAKVNLQKETPLYRVIDETDLPLVPQKDSLIRHMSITTLIGLLFMTVLLGVDELLKK
ncbi:GumC domain-containing protein [Mucilaginibacter ginsenosidivorans]|uniref:Polysaccharide chain length determinant N-terminal domain-containing protein n=1 Tax=Mucilaginibacter ginsenosidivorans TaxID=398053 RepID=A0A5B8USY1_9SPHI|nr:hypothetical protein [Mucilaginibacter ginsenosidivorans]QEC62042.1 hypothetical protein FRZ54_05365 [Mucilaginibacter ginsenosidivorans]